jgi:hypothetical protein
MVLPISSRAMLPCVLICLIIDALCLAFSSFVCPQPISTSLHFTKSGWDICFLHPCAFLRGCRQSTYTFYYFKSHSLYLLPPPKICSALQAQAQLSTEPQWRGSAARRRGTKELAFSNKESFLLSLMGITPQTLHCIRVLGSLYVRPL